MTFFYKDALDFLFDILGVRETCIVIIVVFVTFFTLYEMLRNRHEQVLKDENSVLSQATKKDEHSNNKSDSSNSAAGSNLFVSDSNVYVRIEHASDEIYNQNPIYQASYDSLDREKPDMKKIAIVQPEITPEPSVSRFEKIDDLIERLAFKDLKRWEKIRDTALEDIMNASEREGEHPRRIFEIIFRMIPNNSLYKLQSEEVFLLAVLCTIHDIGEIKAPEKIKHPEYSKFYSQMLHFWYGFIDEDEAEYLGTLCYHHHHFPISRVIDHLNSYDEESDIRLGLIFSIFKLADSVDIHERIEKASDCSPRISDLQYRFEPGFCDIPIIESSSLRATYISWNDYYRNVVNDLSTELDRIGYKPEIDGKLQLAIEAAVH